MIKRRVKAFTLIELVVSLFIVAGLLIIGFYSFHKFEINSNLQRATIEVKTALETAHNYSISLPKDVVDLSKVSYVGVRFYKNPTTGKTDLNSYEYVYTQCTDLSKWNNSSYPLCANSALASIGSRSYFQQGMKLNYNSTDIFPLIFFSLSNSSVAGWCQTDCSSPVMTINPNDIDLKIQYKNYSAMTAQLKVYSNTGIVYEQ